MSGYVKFDSSVNVRIHYATSTQHTTKKTACPPLLLKRLSDLLSLVINGTDVFLVLHLIAHCPCPESYITPAMITAEWSVKSPISIQMGSTCVACLEYANS
jgi:hypothetical protein